MTIFNPSNKRVYRDEENRTWRIIGSDGSALEFAAEGHFLRAVQPVAKGSLFDCFIVSVLDSVKGTVVFDGLANYSPSPSFENLVLVLEQYRRSQEWTTELRLNGSSEGVPFTQILLLFPQKAKAWGFLKQIGCSQPIHPHPSLGR